jgi:GNAT superfamily N-acetyltransferase
MRLLPFPGPDLAPYLDALGDLRIRVFRAYPYLYDGSLDYERSYLRTYLSSSRSLIVLAFDGERVVGATTCVPLSDELPEFQSPFFQHGMDLSTVCYLGESLLLPEYRGQGLGKAFFHHRETHARSLGCTLAAFCAVDRPSDHPQRPADYRPLEGLWTGQGYTRQPHLQARLPWREVGQSVDTEHTLTFWTKPLPPC